MEAVEILPADAGCIDNTPFPNLNQAEGLNQIGNLNQAGSLNQAGNLNQAGSLKKHPTAQMELRWLMGLLIMELMELIELKAGL